MLAASLDVEPARPVSAILIAALEVAAQHVQPLAVEVCTGLGRVAA